MSIVKKPIVTEKLNGMSEKFRRYGFIVDRTANKLQIKKEVELLYGVVVQSVNTIRYAGKVKRRFTKAGVITGRANSYKKAIVTLAPDNKIDFFSNI